MAFNDYDKFLYFLFLPIGEAEVYSTANKYTDEIQNLNAEAYMNGLFQFYSYVINDAGV